MKIILYALAVGIVMWAIFLAIARQEAYECKKWDNEAKQFENYYYASWQLEQCLGQKK